jgi:hypothetical protein
MSNDDARDHEPDAQLTEQIELYEIGGGYLAVKMRREYHDAFERAFPVDHDLLGIISVEDYDALRATLRELGFKDVDELPELSPEDFE